MGHREQEEEWKMGSKEKSVPHWAVFLEEEYMLSLVIV